jgi:hypothetical protein
MANLQQTQFTDTGFVQLPNGNSAARPSGLSVAQGQTRFNSEKGLFEWYNGGGWMNNADWHIEKNLRTSPSYTPRVLIQVESTGLNYSGTRYYRQYVDIEGTNVVNSTAPRSYRFTKLSKNSFGFWEFVSTTGYDVYGNTTAAQNAATALETWDDGDMLILNTWDEPNNNSGYINDILAERFASPIFANRDEFQSRDSRLLVGICGAKKPLCSDHEETGQPPIFYSLWLP